jgi:hypothetical protein
MKVEPANRVDKIKVELADRVNEMKVEPNQYEAANRVGLQVSPGSEGVSRTAKQ